jgi:hypothetical protein
MNSLKSIIKKAKIPYDQFRKKKKTKKLSKPIGGGKRKKTRRRRRKKTRRRRRRRKTRRRRHRRRRTGKRMQGGGILNPQVGDIVYNNRANVRGTIIAIRLEGGGGGGGVAGGGGRGRMKIRVEWNGGGRTGFEYADKPNFVRSNTTGGAGAAADAMQYRQGGAAQNRPIQFAIIAHGNGVKIGSISLQNFPKLVAISNAAYQGCVAYGGFAEIESAVANPYKGHEHLGGPGNPLPSSIDDIGLWCNCCYPLNGAEVAALDGKRPQCLLTVPATHGGPKVVPGKCESANCNDQRCMWPTHGCDPWAGIFVRTGAFPNSKLELINPAPTGQAVYDKYTLSRALHDIQQYMKSKYNGTRTWQVYIHTCRGHRENPRILDINERIEELNKQMAPLLDKVDRGFALSDDEHTLFMALNTKLSKLHFDWKREK